MLKEMPAGWSPTEATETVCMKGLRMETAHEACLASKYQGQHYSELLARHGDLRHPQYE